MGYCSWTSAIFTKLLLLTCAFSYCCCFFHKKPMLPSFSAWNFPLESYFILISKKVDYCCFHKKLINSFGIEFASGHHVAQIWVLWTFFLWNYLKNIAYKSAPQSIAELKKKLRMQLGNWIPLFVEWYAQTCRKWFLCIWRLREVILNNLRSSMGDKNSAEKIKSSLVWFFLVALLNLHQTFLGIYSLQYQIRRSRDYDGRGVTKIATEKIENDGRVLKKTF